MLLCFSEQTQPKLKPLDLAAVANCSRNVGSKDRNFVTIFGYGIVRCLVYSPSYCALAYDPYIVIGRREKTTPCYISTARHLLCSHRFKRLEVNGPGGITYHRGQATSAFHVQAEREYAGSTQTNVPAVSPFLYVVSVWLGM